MNRRPLALLPLALLALGLVLVPATGQDNVPTTDAEPNAVEVHYDLAGLADPQSEAPGSEHQSALPGEDAENASANGVAFSTRPPAGDLNQQFVNAVTACARPGSWGETPALEVKGDVGARGEPAVLPGGFATDPGEPALVVKRPPGVQKEVKALLDSWARFLARRLRVEVELRHYSPDALPVALRATALPSAEALAQARTTGERILAVTKSVPPNARRYVFEKRSRAGKPFAESQNDLDLVEPLLLEMVASPLPGGRFQLALHLASGQWIDAERVLVGRRFGVVGDLEAGKATALARLDDERGTDLLVAKVTGAAPPGETEPFAFYDLAPLMDETDSAAAVTSSDSTANDSPRLARSLLARVNEKLPATGQAVRVGSLVIAPRASRAALLRALAECERPTRTVDVVLGTIDPERVPDDSFDAERFRALAGEIQVLERYAGRVTEGARVLARRAAQAWNAAGERQDSLVARSWADVALLREGDLRILTLRTQTAIGNAHVPICEVPVTASARLERDRYAVVQSSSREGRSTVLLVGEPASRAETNLDVSKTGESPMSRTQTITLLPLLLAAALAGAAFSSGARAQGDGAAAPPAKPAPWEYRVLVLDYTEYSEKDEWKAFMAQEGGNALKADADFRGYVLNYLAHEGWGFVQVVQTKDKLAYVYLKRPRTSDALPQLPTTGEGGAPADPKGYPNPEPRPPRKPH